MDIFGHSAEDYGLPEDYFNDLTYDDAAIDPDPPNPDEPQRPDPNGSYSEEAMQEAVGFIEQHTRAVEAVADSVSMKVFQDGWIIPINRNVSPRSDVYRVAGDDKPQPIYLGGIEAVLEAKDVLACKYRERPIPDAVVRNAAFGAIRHLKVVALRGEYDSDGLMGYGPSGGAVVLPDSCSVIADRLAEIELSLWDAFDGVHDVITGSPTFYASAKSVSVLLRTGGWHQYLSASLWSYYGRRPRLVAVSKVNGGRDDLLVAAVNDPAVMEIAVPRRPHVIAVRPDDENRKGVKIMLEYEYSLLVVKKRAAIQRHPIVVEYPHKHLTRS